jgi:hypothetical protein
MGPHIPKLHRYAVGASEIGRPFAAAPRSWPEGLAARRPEVNLKASGSRLKMAGMY